MKFTSALGVAAGLFGSFASANPYIKEIIANSRKEYHALSSRKAFSSVRGAAAECINGVATVAGEEFPCSNIDFLSFIGRDELKIEEPASGLDTADIWGWLSPSGQEITILGLENGAVIIDSSNSEHPCIIAKLPTNRVPSFWADAKVYKDVLYMVKDKLRADVETPVSEDLAIEAYDLLQFDGIDCLDPEYEVKFVQPSQFVSGHGSTHNVIVNTESGRVYTCGADEIEEFCFGGLMVFDANENPLNPQKIGCIAEDGYTHDAQCVTYDGPDTNFTGKEICFAFNEDTMTIWDATELPATMLSRTLYEDQGYSHQGWLTRDMSKILLDDELDELCAADEEYHDLCISLSATSSIGTITTTRTRIFNVEDLTNPILENVLDHGLESIDHNLYVWGAIHEKGWGGNPPLANIPDPNFAYLNNYESGVRVIDMHAESSEDWTIAGYFDIRPERDYQDFFGAWSGYMHPSGTYAVSSIERGVFFLRPNMAFSEEFPAAPTQSPVPVATPAPVPVPAPSTDGENTILYAVFGVFVLLIVVIVFILARGGGSETSKEVKESLHEEEMGVSPAGEVAATEEKASV